MSVKKLSKTGVEVTFNERKKIVIARDIKLEKHFFVGQRCKTARDRAEERLVVSLIYEKEGEEQTFRNPVEAVQSDEESVPVLPFDQF